MIDSNYVSYGRILISIYKKKNNNYKNIIFQKKDLSNWFKTEVELQ